MKNTYNLQPWANTSSNCLYMLPPSLFRSVDVDCSRFFEKQGFNLTFLSFTHISSLMNKNKELLAHIFITNQIYTFIKCDFKCISIKFGACTLLWKNIVFFLKKCLCSYDFLLLLKSKYTAK